MNKWVAATVAGLFSIPFFSVPASAIVCTTVAACVLGANLGTGAGLEGQSQRNFFGVFGVSTISHGVDGRSTTSFGVVGVTSESASSPANARAGVYGIDSSPNRNHFNSGVAGVSPGGLGVYGNGGLYGGYFVGKFGIFSSDGIDAISDYSGTSGYPQADGAVRAYGVVIPFQSEDDNLFTGVGCTLSPDTPSPGPNNCSTVATIDSYGAATFGSVTSAGSAKYRTKTSMGQDVATYGDRETSPTLEDTGKASLVEGSAYVKLEPMFSSAIRKTNYMVFITPEGNSHGLYTSNFTATGFSVKENDGGRSSLTFDYRIVAQPGDTKFARLPMMAKRKLAVKRWLIKPTEQK